MTNGARERRALVHQAARRYRRAGLVAELFARGKLRDDPIYLGLLERGAIPSGARVLDLGCGQAYLLCLLAVSSDPGRAGRWPAGWPPPPERLRLVGIDGSSAAVRRARIALASDAAIEVCDLREAELAQSDRILLLDVMHYLEPEEQDRLLERIAHALSPSGVLFMRVCDDGARTRAWLTRVLDRFGALTRGQLAWRLYGRSVAAWLAALERVGLSATAEPASQGTPFANVLITARRAAAR